MERELGSPAEQGIDLAYGNWPAIFGPKSLSPAQLAYWQGALRKMSETAGMEVGSRE